MRAGKAIREAKALEHAGDKLCGCGHQMREHRELLAVFYAFDPESGITETANPDYEPLAFHCHHEGCGCIRREEMP